MEFDGRKVKPMRRKGIIRVTQDNQGMKQFQWCDADTKNAIDVSSISCFNEFRVFMCSQATANLRRSSNLRTGCTCWSFSQLNRDSSIGFRKMTRKRILSQLKRFIII